MRNIHLLCGGAALALTTISSASDRPAIGSWGVDLTGIDHTIAPGDDFVGFANGAWSARTTIPDDRVAFGPFSNMRANAEDQTRSLLDALPAIDERPTDQTGKVAALYQSFLNEGAVNARGDRPLRDLIGDIAGTADRGALARIMGKANAGLGASFVDLEFGADYATGHGYVLNLRQGGLRLSREYYLESRHSTTLRAYRAYVARLLTLAGWPQPEQAATDVIAIETEIAKASWTAAAMRDPLRTANPIEPSRLAAIAPGFPWQQFLAAAGTDGKIRLNLETPESVARIATIFRATPLPALKSWLAFRTADNAAPYLTQPYQSARFEFQRSIGGSATPPPRWRRAVAFANDAMGSAVGELYVARYFDSSSQASIERLVDTLREAFGARIRAAAWMSEPTRAEALRKLAALEVQVGRPRTSVDYEGLTVSKHDLFGNVLAAQAFDWRRRVAAAHGAWDKSNWRFWPQFPTAYAENRQLIFTAAMLQPPFFDPHADLAVNYGAIGAVIGHELSHQFDDQGRMGDADGRRRDWWAPTDAVRFREQARRLSEQFSQMEPLPGLHLNGDLTLGENIADLAGLSVALEAYHASLAGKPAPVIDGLTGDQRFFLSWAQTWREKVRPERLKDSILSDVHSPASARIEGPIRNIDDWYAAWKIRPDARLYIQPDRRVRLW
jgi:putative endopeptidase